MFSNLRLRQPFHLVPSLLSSYSTFLTSSLFPLHRRPIPYRSAQWNSFSSSPSPSPRSPFELSALRLLQRLPHPQLKPKEDASSTSPSTPSPPTDLMYSGVISSVNYDSPTRSLTVSVVPDRHFREVKSLIHSELSKEIHALDPDVTVQVIMSKPPKPPLSSSSSRGGASSSSGITGLSRVKHLIAVSSCKGGVGKSTIALNLAFALAETKRVGILDADIHGPSLPTLVKLNDSDDIASRSPNEDSLIEPLKYGKVSLMSFGYLNRGNVKSAAIMRGAMVSNVIRDLLTKTNWPVLDYLIIDMPPGTGDVAITLMQSLNLTGALVVTAPQRLAYVDVIKGIELFIKTRVPILGIVENFSYFQCTKCNEEHHIFGESHVNELKDMYKEFIQSGFKVPMAKEINTSCDQGVPFVTDPSILSSSSLSPSCQSALESYRNMAMSIISQTSPESLASHPFLQRFSLGFDPANDDPCIFIQNDRSKEKWYVKPKALRLQCKCAGCVDESTGQKKLTADMIQDNIMPVKMEKKGNYAVAFNWSDGHNSTILDYFDIIKTATPVEGKQKEQEL